MLEGFVGVLSKIFGSKDARDVKELQPIIDNALEIEKTLLSIFKNQMKILIYQTLDFDFTHL